MLAAIGCVVVAAAVVLQGPVRSGSDLARARAAIRRHDWPAAIALVDGVERRGRVAEAEFLRGRVLRRQGRADEAETCLAAAESLGWDREAVRRQRLLATAQTSGIKRVEEELTALVSAGADDDFAEECYEAMTRGLVASFRLDEAARCVRYWTDWQGTASHPWLWQGLLEERLERPGLALDAYRTALARDPESYEAAFNVARMELETGKVDEAQRYYEACHARRPDDPDAAVGLASCLLRSGDTGRAAALLRESLTLDIDPGRAAAALADLGQLALEEGEPDRAAALYRHALDLDAGNIPARQGLAAVLARLGDREAAAAQLATAQAIGDVRRRLMAVRRRAIGDQHNADLRAEAGGLLLEMGDVEEATRWLETALHIDPGHEGASRLLARCRHVAGEKTGSPTKKSRGPARSS
jgi:tetratricopeptide (TPR) repeat protein